jgi:hypothetical protein
MPRLKIKIDDQQLNDDQLREGLSGFVSNNDAVGFVKAMGHLMKSGDLAFWLSPRLMRKLKAFAVEKQAESSQVVAEVDDTLFLSWLQRGGSLEPNLRWEMESLPNNGGIYRMLLEGGQDGKGVHNNQG